MILSSDQLVKLLVVLVAGPVVLTLLLALKRKVNAYRTF